MDSRQLHTTGAGAGFPSPHGSFYAGPDSERPELALAGEFPAWIPVDPPMELLLDLVFYGVWAAFDFQLFRRLSLFCRSRIRGWRYPSAPTPS